MAPIDSKGLLADPLELFHSSKIVNISSHTESIITTNLKEHFGHQLISQIWHPNFYLTLNWLVMDINPLISIRIL